MIASKKGFTFVEILIVVGIIALLTAIIVPGLLRSQKETRAAIVKAEEHSFTASSLMNPDNNTFGIEFEKDGTSTLDSNQNPNKKAIKILLVNDQMMVQAGLANIIKDDPNLTVSSQATDGMDAIAKIAQSQPDVIIMDIDLPGLSGIETTKKIKELYPEIKIIGLSNQNEPATLDSMIKAGAETSLDQSDLNQLIDTILNSVKTEK